MLKLLFLPLALGLSCTQINTSSREHYTGDRNFRHGVVPKTSTKTAGTQEVQVENLPQDSVERGEVLYEIHCLSCHGANGKGNGPQAAELESRPKNLSELAKTVPQFKFYMMVSRQKGQMPGWRTIFTDQEIADLENYLKTL